MSAEKLTPTAWGANENLPGPGRELYEKVRGAALFYGHGTFRQVCQRHGWDESFVRNALLGVSNHEKAQRVRADILRAVGLVEAEGDVA